MPDAPLDTVRAEFFRALARPVKIRILRLLRPGARSATELQESLGLESSSASQQLTALRIRNLATARKEGTRVLYTVTSPQVFQQSDARMADLLQGRADVPVMLQASGKQKLAEPPDRAFVPIGTVTDH